MPPKKKAILKTQMTDLKKIISSNPYKRTKKELQEIMENSPDIDENDIKILSLLQQAGRASFNDIAKVLGMSVATISSRVGKLMEMGVIKGYSAVVACDKLGFKENLWLQLFLKPGANADYIGTEVGSLRGVKCVYRVFSDFDLLVHLCCATDQDIDSAIQTIGTYDGVDKLTKMSVYKKLKEDFRVQI
ncbi:MAG: Lrp/AsnC family transcriptional regulator [Candidatus Thorarchaeota archaeon]